MPAVRSLIKGLSAAACIGVMPVSAQAGDEHTVKESIIIKLQDETAISETQYTLGQIAKIYSKETKRTEGKEIRDTKETKLIEQLKTLTVGRTPRVGYLDKVRQTEIVARIEKEYPGLRKQIMWQGSAIAKVRSVGTAYDKNRIIDVARIGLNNWLGKRYSNYTIHAAGEYQDVLLPKGDVQVVPRMNEDAQLNKRMSVWVDILIDGERYQSLPIWFSVEVPMPALVMGVDAKRGNAIIDNQVRKEVIDIAAVSGIPVLEKHALNNKRLQKDIKAGQAITADMMEDMPQVVKDNEVIVEAQVGAVTVKAVAIAMEDGRMGDRVKVRKPDNGIEYKVTVIGRNLVSSTKE